MKYIEDATAHTFHASLRLADFGIEIDDEIDIATLTDENLHTAAMIFKLIILGKREAAWDIGTLIFHKEIREETIGVLQQAIGKL